MDLSTGWCGNRSYLSLMTGDWFYFIHICPMFWGRSCFIVCFRCLDFKYCSLTDEEWKPANSLSYLCLSSVCIFSPLYNCFNILTKPWAFLHTTKPQWLGDIVHSNPDTNVWSVRKWPFCVALSCPAEATRRRSQSLPLGSSHAHCYTLASVATPSLYQAEARSVTAEPPSC